MAVVSADRAGEVVFQRCRSLYRDVLTAVYKDKGPQTKLNHSLGDDDFRYEALPSSLTSGKAISKEQLARLVRWKITHGVYRPFLPGMIQKNDDATVEEHTTKAGMELKLSWEQDDDAMIDTVMKALDIVCKLKGVGPATGTLVLSCFDAKHVPFFEDELFAWLWPDHTAKLKYNKKEYKMLLSRALKMMREHDISAVELEQTAFVLMNSQYLTEAQKSQILIPEDDTANTAKTDKASSVKRAREPTSKDRNEMTSPVDKPHSTSSGPAGSSTDPTIDTRRSKRRKK